MRSLSATLALVLIVCVTAWGQDADRPSSTIDALLEEIGYQQVEITTLRSVLAQAQVDAAQARAEATELRQFVQDHHDYGPAYENYKAIKEIADREARLRRQDDIRAQREAERAERIVKIKARRAEQQEEGKYKDAGLTSIGLDIFVGKMSYHYAGENQVGIDLDYDPFWGVRLPRLYNQSSIEFGSMTLSGSIVNGAKEVRNVGVAVVFFDELGAQVGGEIVQIHNARPDVPYPFTKTVAMALNRPFSSSSVYVLYADSIGSAEQTRASETPEQRRRKSTGQGI